MAMVQRSHGAVGTHASASQQFFANVFNKGTATLQRNKADLLASANWDNVNLRCLVLSIRDTTTSSGDTVSNMRVMVLPFRGRKDFARMPVKRGRYDEVSDTLEFVVYPPWGQTGVSGKTWEKLLPANPAQWEYHHVRPFDVLFISAFGKKIAPTHVCQLVDLVDVKVVRFDREDGTSGANVRSAHMSFVPNRFKPHDLMAALSTLPQQVLRLEPVEKMKSENTAIVIHFASQLRQAPDASDLRRAGIFVKIAPSAERSDYILQKDDRGELPKIYAKVAANALQWEDGAFDDESAPEGARQSVMLQLTLWDQFCLRLGISDPAHWVQFAPYLMRSGWTGVFTVDQKASRSMPCNMSRHGQSGDFESQQQQQDEEDDMQLGGGDPKAQYDFGLALRTQIALFPVEKFYAMYGIPVDVKTLKALQKTIAMVPFDDNMLNSGKSGNNHVRCLSEMPGLSLKPWTTLNTEGKGTFRVITNCVISLEQMVRIPDMTPEEGGKFLLSLRPRTEEIQPRYYLFFVFNTARDPGYLENCAKAAKSCAGRLRIPACLDRIRRLKVTDHLALENADHPALENADHRALEAPPARRQQQQQEEARPVASTSRSAEASHPDDSASERKRAMAAAARSSKRHKSKSSSSSKRSRRADSQVEDEVDPE